MAGAGQTEAGHGPIALILQGARLAIARLVARIWGHLRVAERGFAPVSFVCG